MFFSVLLHRIIQTFLTQKELKKAAKLKADKDLFLGLGWLLREDKIEASEKEDELCFKLK